MHSANMHYRPSDKTLFKNIYQLMPGHFLIYKNGEIKINKYWDLDYKKEADVRFVKSEREYIEEFREILTEAVKLRLFKRCPRLFSLKRWT